VSPLKQVADNLRYNIDNECKSLALNVDSFLYQILRQYGSRKNQLSQPSSSQMSTMEDTPHQISILIII